MMVVIIMHVSATLQNKQKLEIVRAHTITNFCFGWGVPLHRDCNFAIMGGGDFHGV
jgi:hypothetical protein